MTSADSLPPDRNLPCDAPSAHNRAALEALFRAQYDRLYGVAYHYVRSRALAEEIVQDAFLHLWTRRSGWGQARDLVRYVAAAVRNRALSHLRRERLEMAWQQRAAGGMEDIVLSQFAQEGAAVPETDGAVERVRTALRELPERTQYTLALRLYRQLTNPEIAEVMGITVKAVERNVARAIQALRIALADDSDSG